MSQQPAPRGQSQSAGRYVMPTIATIIVIAILAFILQNRQSIKISWLFWSFSWPLWLLLVVTILLSLIAGQILLMLRRHRRRKARREARDY
ncbi:MAG TPA: LapA family protein [Thermoleophilia bacterium]|nr:LapA family protein [Thermoleophilia bacterium]